MFTPPVGVAATKLVPLGVALRGAASALASPATAGAPAQSTHAAVAPASRLKFVCIVSSFWLPVVWCDGRPCPADGCRTSHPRVWRRHLADAGCLAQAPRDAPHRGTRQNG